MKDKFQYAVKFVCGDSEGEVVAPGRYWTAINVHNPTESRVVFNVRVAVALPHEPGPVSKWFKSKLGPGQALEIDCPDIRKHVKSQDEHLLKGFAVIRSPVKLDVVAVYTAAGCERAVEAFHTERVLPLRLRRVSKLESDPG